MERQSNRVVVSARDLAHISRCLASLVQNGNANCALLLDSSGQVVRSAGETEELDTTSLGALLAGNFGSAREIARLLKERSFTALFQQGEQASVYTHLVNDRWLLSVVFDRRTQVGLVKSLTHRSAAEIEKLLRKAPAGARAMEAVVSPEWRIAADQALTQALGGADSSLRSE